MTKISIAMATYNGERFLMEQLESLVAQSKKPDELVVCDDGSTDSTLTILEQFAAKAPFPVHVHRNSEKLGYRANFMKAAQLCTGDYIAFCDQDDVWFPEKLKQCLDAFAPGVLLVYHHATVTDEALNPVADAQGYTAPQRNNPALSLEPSLFGLGFTQMMHRSLLGYMDAWPASHDFFKATEREAHDQWFFFLAASLGTVVYLKQSLAFYRRHSSTTTKHTIAGKWKRYWMMLGHKSLEGIESRAACAAHRATVLEKVQAQEAARRYRQLADWYGTRLSLYRNPSRIARVRTLLSLRTQGCYGPRAAWGVGNNAMLRDIWFGILLPS